MIPTSPPAQFSQEVDRRPSLVQRDGSVLEVRGRPYFARVIQHRGEDFEFLRSLGFNTIELSATATEDQLKMAAELDLWLVCPAPPSAGLKAIPFEYDRVLAWSLGNDLTGHDLQNIRARSREIRESDQRGGRPIVGDVHSHWQHLGNELDILSIGVQPIGSSFIASTYSDWLRLRRASLGNNKPMWAEIQTEIPQVINQQIAAAAKKSPPTPIEPQQIKFLIYEAIAGGRPRPPICVPKSPRCNGSREQTAGQDPSVGERVCHSTGARGSAAVRSWALWTPEVN